MKKLFLAYGLLAISFSSAFAQTLDWKKNVFTNPLDDSQFNKIVASQFGPDGKIYSIGYFTGFRVNFDGTVLKADSIGFSNFVLLNPSWPGTPESIFLSCHESNGSLAWVKTITTVENGSSPFGSFPYYYPKTGFSSLGFDNSGNLLAAGSIYGSTISFGGQAFEANTEHHQRRFILRISPTGNLIWGRSEPAGTVISRGVRERNGLIEAYFTGFEAEILRTNLTGTSLPSIKANPLLYQNIGFNTLGNNLSGGYLHGTFELDTPIPGYAARLLEFNADLSLSREKVATLNRGAAGTRYLLPYATHSLADSQQIVLLTGILKTGNNRLFWGNDTLDFTVDMPLGPQTPRSIFVRLSNLGCMKKVSHFASAGTGKTALTPNGNILVLSGTSFDEEIFNQPAILRMVSKNGEELDTLNLGTAGLSYGIYELCNSTQTMTISNHYQLSWHNGAVAGCHGQFLFKASFTDPVVEAQSFAGCLSNRALLLNTAKSRSNTLSLKVFEKEPGQWQVQAAAGTQGEWQVVSLLGQRLMSVKMENGSATFSSNGLPGGMYLLQSTSKNGAEIQRFVVK